MARSVSRWNHTQSDHAASAYPETTKLSFAFDLIAARPTINLDKIYFTQVDPNSSPSTILARFILALDKETVSVVLSKIDGGDDGNCTHVL